MGVSTTLVHAGKYKVKGNPFEPLSDEARAALQADVDDVYALFVADVAAGRGASDADVRSGYGEGRVLSAARAVDAGLVDRVATFEDVVSGLVAGEQPRAGRSARAETLPAAVRAAETVPAPVADPTPSPSPCHPASRRRRRGLHRGGSAVAGHPHPPPPLTA